MAIMLAVVASMGGFIFGVRISAPHPRFIHFLTFVASLVRYWADFRYSAHGRLLVTFRTL